MHTVPQIILQQLGGRRFIAMTGAKNFIGSATDITFYLPANLTTRRINRIRITLNDKDLYDLEFLRIHKLTCKVLDTVNDVYAEDLQNVFTRATGLETHL